MFVDQILSVPLCIGYRAFISALKEVKSSVISVTVSDPIRIETTNFYRYMTTHRVTGTVACGFSPVPYTILISILQLQIVYPTCISLRPVRVGLVLYISVVFEFYLLHSCHLYVSPQANMRKDCQVLLKLIQILYLPATSPCQHTLSMFVSFVKYRSDES